MASLADFYNPTASFTPTIADIEMQSSDARNDAALAQSRNTDQYQKRMLPDLVNHYAARGTFYGGQAGVAADRLKDDVATQNGDIQRMLDRNLAALRRQGILAATGVALGQGSAAPAAAAEPTFSAQPVAHASPPVDARTGRVAVNGPGGQPGIGSGQIGSTPGVTQVGGSYMYNGAPLTSYQDEWGRTIFYDPKAH